ncbi:MAG: hypothetical protein ACERKV_02985 [Clostridiaceae bacterium]
MKKNYLLILILIFTSIILPTTAFAENQNSNSVIPVKNAKQIDYAQLLINQNIDQLLQTVDDYKSRNPEATEDEILIFFENQILENSKQLETSSNNITSRSITNIDYTKFLPTTTSELGPTEKSVFNSDPLKGAMALCDAQYAIDATIASWSNSNGYHNDNADAFRHSLWNALMSKHCGTSYAERFANAHETDNPNNDKLERDMDINNNSVGRNLGISKPYNYPNGMAIVNAITTDVLLSVKSGMMKRYVGGDIGTLTYLVNTNSNDTPATTNIASNVFYQVYVDGRWLPNVTNLNDYAGIYGRPIQCIYANGDKSQIRYRVHLKGGNWLSWVTQRQDYAGIYGRNIDGLQVESLDSSRYAKYRVYVGGRWLSWVNDLSDYAGIYGNNIEGIQMELINK